MIRRRSDNDRDDTPSIEISGELAELVTAWLKARAAEHAAEGKRKSLEQKMTPIVRQLHREQCRKDGCIHNGIRLDAGPNGQIVMHEFQRFNKMGSLEAEDQLRTIFGRADFERSFKKKTRFMLDPSRLTDVVAERLLVALGDAAAEVLEVESVVVPTEEYWRDRTLNETVRQQVSKAELLNLAIPFAPSFKRVADPSHPRKGLPSV